MKTNEEKIKELLKFFETELESYDSSDRDNLMHLIGKINGLTLAIKVFENIDLEILKSTDYL
ncbi:MAG TPA: hypothetical protein VJN02_03100 [Gammaproteobacteria bacterium]|nr:hypothetical protein [Gammaproteobacteria bacterium]